jgi:hypothetical protein
LQSVGTGLENRNNSLAIDRAEFCEIRTSAMC